MGEIIVQDAVVLLSRRNNIFDMRMPLAVVIQSVPRTPPHQLETGYRGVLLLTVSQRSGSNHMRN